MARYVHGLSVIIAVSGVALSAFAQTQAPVNTQPSPEAQPAKAPMKAPPKAPGKPGTADQPVPTGGEITFAEHEKDFGVISDDKNVNHEFHFKNTGTGVLEISRTQGSCGCTVPALEKKTYQPGEEGIVKVEYHPQNRRGPQHTSVTVTSNDASKPQVVLDLKSEVRPLVMAEPQVVNVGQVQKGKGNTVRALITSRLKGVSPISATPTIASVEAKVMPGKEMELNGEEVMQYPIDIIVPPTAPVGQIVGNVAVRTSDPARTINITVTGEVVGDVLANPARLQLGAATPGQPLSSEVRLTSRSGKPFKVSKVEEQSGTPNKAFSEVTFKEDKTANPPAYVITVSGMASQTPGAIRGDLLVTTDIPGEEQVKIGYFGFIRAQPKAPTGWEDQPSTLIPTGPR